MSVLCCYTSDFTVKIAQRYMPSWQGKPLAVIDDEERVIAVSAEAAAEKISPGLKAREARARVPGIVLSPLSEIPARDEQHIFIEVTAGWELPLECSAWGTAYIDLHGIGNTKEKIAPLCREMGRRLRQRLGDDLQPSLGWDSGKFTARAAAQSSRPGHMRLVDKADEQRFLEPLPIALLPLPGEQIQSLLWLGIETLGAYAALPEMAVWQRFGPMGKLAHRLAGGSDDRPVVANQEAAADAPGVVFDPPCALLSRVVDEMTAQLASRLQELRHLFQGLTSLVLALTFLDGTEKELRFDWIEPLSDSEILRRQLNQRLQTLSWPDELVEIRLLSCQVGEQPGGQLSFFPSAEARQRSLAEVARQLSGRFEGLFRRVSLVEGSHTIPERRIQLDPL